MMKFIPLSAAILSAVITSGCAVSGPRVWVEPPAIYVPAVVVEPAPTVVVVEERHYHSSHKRHRHYSGCNRCN